jgi:hypothetical protein
LLDAGGSVKTFVFSPILLGATFFFARKTKFDKTKTKKRIFVAICTYFDGVVI